MDFGNILTILAVAVGLTAVLIVIGFNIPAKVRVPVLSGEQQTLRKAELPADLPAPLLRYYRQVYGEVPYAQQSVAAWGRGKFSVRKFPVIGNLWVPDGWTLHLVPGQAFVWRARFYWLRRMLLDGGDEYKQGHGRFLMGGQASEGENMDRSERVALWLYTLAVAPTAPLEHPGAQWQALDEHSVQVSLPYEDETLTFHLFFDPQTGSLARVETQRPASKSGILYRFQMFLSRYQKFEGGITLPSHFCMAWEDDIFNHYDVLGVSFNAPVADVIQSGVEG